MKNNQINIFDLKTGKEHNEFIGPQQTGSSDFITVEYNGPNVFFLKIAGLMFRRFQTLVYLFQLLTGFMKLVKWRYLTFLRKDKQTKSTLLRQNLEVIYLFLLTVLLIPCLLVIGFGVLTYNLRRNLLGAICVGRIGYGKILYHLFKLRHCDEKSSNESFRFLRKTKWPSLVRTRIFMYVSYGNSFPNNLLADMTLGGLDFSPDGDVTICFGCICSI